MPSTVASGPNGDSYGDRSLRALITCMADKGWSLTYDPVTGGVSGDVPPDQREAHQAAADACRADFEKENPPKAMTQGDYRRLYQLELRTMKCLDKQGYPASAPPISEQQYVDEYASGRPPSWYAYQALGPTPSPELLAKLEKTCPQPTVDE